MTTLARYYHLARTQNFKNNNHHSTLAIFLPHYCPALFSGDLRREIQSSRTRICEFYSFGLFQLFCLVDLAVCTSKHPSQHHALTPRPHLCLPLKQVVRTALNTRQSSDIIPRIVHLFSGQFYPLRFATKFARLEGPCFSKSFSPSTSIHSDTATLQHNTLIIA